MSNYTQKTTFEESNFNSTGNPVTGTGYTTTTSYDKSMGDKISNNSIK